MITKTKVAKTTHSRPPGRPTAVFFQKKGDVKKSASPFFRPSIQQQVVTGEPGDAYEREADAMADVVTARSAAPESPRAGLFNRISPLVQRQAEDETDQEVQAKVDDERDGKEQPVQARSEDDEVQAQVEDGGDVQSPALEKEKNGKGEIQAEAEETEDQVQAQQEEEEEVQAQAEEVGDVQPQAFEEEENEKGEVQAEAEETEDQVQDQQEDEEVQAQAEDGEDERLQAQADEQEGQRDEEVQAKTNQDAAVQARRETSVLPGSAGFVRQQLRSRRGLGSRLPDGVRKDMELSFAADFSGVRIHTDEPAVQLTRLLKARAFTHGRDIFFSEGRFAPQTRNGEHLLAHELTHTIQQGAAGPSEVQLDAPPTAIQRKEDDESTILIRPELLHAIRLARGEIGKVNAKHTDADGMRKGWERLYEYFFTAFGDREVIHKDVIRFINPKYRMPSWCGIYVWWALKEAGLPITDWKIGGRILEFAKQRKPREMPRKGDIAYKGPTRFDHFALVSGVENPQSAEGKSFKSIQVATVNGNTTGEDVLGGEIQEKWEPIGNWLAFFDPVAKLNLPEVPLVKTSVEPDDPTADEDTARPPREPVKDQPTDVSDLEEREIATPAQLPASAETQVNVELPAPAAPPKSETVAKVQQLALEGSSDQAMVSFTEASPSQMATTQPALGGKLDEKIGAEQSREVENSPVLVAKTSGTVEEGITPPNQIPLPGDAKIGDGVVGGDPGNLAAQPHQNKGQTPNNKHNEKLLDKQDEGGFLDWLQRNMTGFMRSIRTKDTGLNTSAGDRPNVKLNGEADPGRVDQQRGDANAELTAQRDGATATFRNHPGQQNIQPKAVNEERSTNLAPEKNVTIETPADTGVADYAAAPLSADVRNRADELLKPGLDTNLRESKSETQQAATQKENDKKAAVSKAQSDAANINSKADEEQRRIVIGNRKVVAQKQTAAIEEAYGNVNGFNQQADGKQKNVRKEVGDKVKDSESKAKQELERGERDAETKRQEGEKEAAGKKRELDESQEKSSWWDRVASVIKKAVKAITKAIDAIFAKIRQAVKNLIDKAKNAAIGLINRARDWVVNKLNAFRDWAKDQVNKYLKERFPGLAKRINGAIDSVVDTAIDGVNIVADAAIAGVEALAKSLTAALDKVLQVFQTALKAAVQVAGAVLTGDFAEALRIAIQAACDIAGIDSQTIFGFIDRAAATVMDILKHPKKFFNNLMAAVAGGVRNFAKNIKQHLIKGLIGWLTGALSEADIRLPDKFDFKGILSLVLQILGLTYANIKAKIIKRFPPAAKVFSAVEKALTFVRRLITEGPIALWKMVKQGLSNLKEMVLSGIRSFVVTKVVTEAVTWLFGLLNPAGALAKLLKLAFDFVMFLKNRFQQIKDFVLSVYNSIAAIASGALTKAMQAVEGALARSLPVVISLLASLAGLGGIGATVKKLIGKVRKPIDKVIDKVIEKVIKFAKKLLKKGKAAAKKVNENLMKWWNIKKSFKGSDNKPHQLFYKGQGTAAKIHVASSVVEITTFLKAKAATIKAVKDDGKRESLTRAQEKVMQLAREADALEQKIEARKKGRKKDQPVDAQTKQMFGELKRKLDSLTAQVRVLFLEDDPEYPPAVLPPFTDGVRARGFTAEYISKKTPEGSAPAGQMIPGWKVIDDHDLGVGAKWVRMHLLPEPLGGKGKASNLVPAEGPGTNFKFRDNVEHPARDFVKKGAATEGNLIWYKVAVQFGGHGEKRFKHFPKSISAQFGAYDWDGKKWKRIPVKGEKDKWAQSLKPPDISGAPALKEFYLDQDGRDRLKKIPGVGGFGGTIWKERKQNGAFGSKGVFRTRMETRDEQSPQSKIQDLETKIRAIETNPNVKMRQNVAT